MFKNVLVGVDGGPNGRDAVALAARLTDPDGALTLAHVRSGELLPSMAMTPGVVKAEREASEKLLAEAGSGAGRAVELVGVLATSPGRGLHQQAEQQAVDLLVVGSCSHSGLGRAMLGDDTRAALNGAPCAVAIAARGYAASDAPIANIGVGYNDTPESAAALELARLIAAASGAKIHALEVVSIPTVAFTGLMPPLLGDSVELMLGEAEARLKALKDVETSAIYGLAGEELAAFGADKDILVVGSRGYGPLKRLVLGSTSEFLEHNARCSLLVLPRSRT